MIEQPKRGLEVVFKPPQNAYSAFSQQIRFAGQSGILEAWNGYQARVRFSESGRPIRVNVNVDYIYDLYPRQAPASPNTLFSE